MKRLLCIALSLVSCAKAPRPKDKEPVTPEIRDVFVNAENRILDDFLDNGWIVSKTQSGAVEHIGDSLIWTGLWLGVASCDAGSISEDALQAAIGTLHGAITRHYSLDDASLDGALGLYRGIIERVTRCPESREGWASVLALHAKFVEDHDGQLNANARDARLIPEFDYVLLRIMDSVSGNGNAHRDVARFNRLMVGVTAWAASVVASRSAAFRVHLALLAIQTLEALGESAPPDGRNAFCATTKGLDMPTLDDWCGRGDLKAWIEGFQFNIFEYRHQRAGLYETPDAGNLRTPGLDLLVAIRQRYNSL